MNYHLTNIRRTLVVALCLGLLVVAIGAPSASAAPAPAPYMNGFEATTDATACPTGIDSETMYGVTRVPSGTGGITSADGGYHATAPIDAPGCGILTRLGGYSSTFPAAGYTVSIDLYLDTALSGTTATRLDWSSAINKPDGTHWRDFIFNIGGDGAGNWIMSASNNAPGWPANPDRDPYTITTSGWYTFQHVFRNNAGVLAVDMNVLDAGGTLLKSWTLSDPTDTIGVNVGGNRYAWLVTNDFANLPIDNVTRSGYCTTVCYADVAGGNDANDGITPATAKKTIQAAINAVDVGGEVRVLPGTYPESPDVNKSLTLVSTGGRDVTTIQLQPQPVAPTYLGSLQIDGETVTVDGFTITGFDADCADFGVDGDQDDASTNVYATNLADIVTLVNNRFKVGNKGACTTWDDAIGVATYYDLSNNLTQLTVEDNLFEPVGAAASRAFYVNPAVDGFTFRGNMINGQFNAGSYTQAMSGLIENNTINGTGTSRGMGTWGYPDPTLYGATVFRDNTISNVVNGITIYGSENVTVTKNTFTGNDRAVWVDEDVAFDLSTIHINRNSIAGNDMGVENWYTTAIDATCNWWGDASGPGPVGPGSGSGVSTDVDFAPFLTTADLDGLCAQDIFMSTTLPGTTADGLAFGMEDIIAWDGVAWSMWFDGSAAGLAPTGKWKHNINAFYIPDPGDDDVYISFTQNSRFIPGITPKVDGMDLVKWDGTAWSLYFDGSDVGLTNKTQEKIDALHILPGSASPIGGSCQNYLLISTQGPGRVTNHDGSTLRFGGEDVLGFCLTNAGNNTAGFWHMVLDGSAEGMPRNATDSISMSADGNTLYLTTKRAFNVDAASGGHSMVYTYDMVSGSFAGPVFDAPANGLPKTVDALQVTDLP